MLGSRSIVRKPWSGCCAIKRVPVHPARSVIGRWPLERVMASCGLLTSAELEFVAADDVPNGGVLCALPALLAEGLLRHTRTFYRLPPGFYPLESIFLALALLARVRCRSLEQSRYLSHGEWGKLLGLDRLPEVKTLRRKISDLCGQDGQAARVAEPLGWGVDARRTQSERGPVLCRWPRARLSRAPDRSATPLRGARTALSAGHHRLLDQRPGWRAVFRSHPTSKSRPHRRAATAHRATACGRSPAARH